MISRRKFLQGVAILPILPMVSIKGETPVGRFSGPPLQMAYVEPFNFYPNPEDKGIPTIWHDDAMVDHLIKLSKILDEKNVPQDNRYIWRIEHVT